MKWEGAESIDAEIEQSKNVFDLSTAFYSKESKQLKDLIKTKQAVILGPRSLVHYGDNMSKHKKIGLLFFLVTTVIVVSGESLNFDIFKSFWCF